MILLYINNIGIDQIDFVHDMSYKKSNVNGAVPSLSRMFLYYKLYMLMIMLTWLCYKHRTHGESVQ